MTWADKFERDHQAFVDSLVHHQAAKPPAEALIFERPSRSGGPPHVVTLDRETLAPYDPDLPCNCAGGRKGAYCWALLDVLANELPRLSADPQHMHIARLAAELRKERGRGRPARR